MMKRSGGRIVSILLVTALVFSGVSCSGDTADVSVQTEGAALEETVFPETTASEAEASETAAVTEEPQETDEQKMIEYATRGLMAGLDDPYSYYLDESDNETYDENITGNYVGIGVTLTPGDQGEIRVLSPFDGSPAQEAGIKAGDILYKINGKEYNYDSIDEAVGIMRGHKGEKVNLELIREGSDNIVVDVVRGEIEIASVTSEKIEDDIICLRISRFDVTTGDDFIEKFKELKTDKNTKVILDLRDNPGGVVTSALTIADYFIDSGILMTEKYKNEDDVVNKADSEAADISYPIVMLANGNSASASEIVTGALKDNKKAVLIGETTYGKGILNQKFPLPDKSALVLSIGEYTTPDGTSIHKKGIAPDIEVELPEEYRKMSISELEYEQDTQLQKAVEYLKKGEAN